MSDEAAATTTTTPASAADTSPAHDNGAIEPANDNADTPTAPDYWDVDALPEDVAGRMVKMRIDGKDVMVSLAQALKGTQRFKAATKKEMAAAAATKAAEEKVQRWLTDPTEPLSQADETVIENTLLKLIQSGDPKVQRAADKAFRRLLELQQMKPEDRDRLSLEEERAKIKAEREEWDAEQKRRKQEAELEPMRKRIVKEFTDAAGKVGMKPTARIMQRMIDVGLEVNGAGLDWRAEDIANHVREELEDEHRALYGQADGEQLARVLGDEGVKRVREREVARVRAKQAQQPTRHTAEREAPKTERRPTTDELRERWSNGRR